MYDILLYRHVGVHVPETFSSFPVCTRHVHCCVPTHVNYLSLFISLPLPLSLSLSLSHSTEHYHADMVNIPAPHSVAPPPLGGVHTVGQPSSAVSTNDSSSSGNHYDGGVAPAGVTGFTASQLPTSSGGGSGRSNKGQLLNVVAPSLNILAPPGSPHP